MQSRTPRSLRAFTLVELLVVLGIIALIIGIVLVAMGGVRSNVQRTESGNALRQMLVAYDHYSTDHDKRLMPGHVKDITVTAMNILAEHANGTKLTAEDSRGYVWRLAPYLGHQWDTMFVDYASDRLMSRLDGEYNANVFGPGSMTAPATQFGIARIPAFGLNSMFLGGDNSHCLLAMPDTDPWNTAGNRPLAATRLSEVKNPAHLLVFAPCQQGNPALNPTEPMGEVVWGDEVILPPFLLQAPDDTWSLNTWELAGDGSSIAVVDNVVFTQGGGIPIARWGSGAFPVVNLDGSTVVETYTSLSNDMRRWSPSARGHFID